jgi:dihydroflavonol-4-reductase
MPTALVLGATGFIGGHIALAALEQGWEVRGLRRSPHAVGHTGTAPIRWLPGDIDQPDTLIDAFRDIDIVFHAAGYYPRTSRDVPAHVARSVRQTRAVIQACRRAGSPKLVYTSSLTTIGRPEPPGSRLADERDLYEPGSLSRSAYYECKYAMESEMLRACNDLEVVATNPTAVFGPGDRPGGLSSMLVAVARGWGLAWVEATVNVVDVRDVAAAHLRAATVGRSGERYLLGGHNSAVRDLMILAARLAGVAPPRFRLPLGWIDLAVRLGDFIPPLDFAGNHLRAIRLWQGYDCAKAVSQLGLNPRPLEETLRDALDWLGGPGAEDIGRSVV